MTTLAVTWSPAWCGVLGQVVEGWAMYVEGDHRAVVFPNGFGWAVQEDAGHTVVAVRPSMEEAKQAAVDWILGLREISRTLRRLRLGEL
ncbi:MAG TPA: hypothetical protein VFX70_06395 [Mycobacteriales bacterium]|nr:hypothetical protein [Mycobacteriales bacterium]